MFLMAWILAPANKALITVQDRAGKRATTGFWVSNTNKIPDDPAPDALSTAVALVSDGLMTKVEVLQYATQDAPGAVPANTFRGSDKVKLHFSDGLGVKGSMQIGAIKPAYLESDGVTLVAPSGTGPGLAVKALQDALKAAAVTAEGGPIENFFPAKRMRNPRIKKQ
jgi:hypothetical protein